jgi:hypothetical protein
VPEVPALALVVVVATVWSLCCNVLMEGFATNTRLVPIGKRHSSLKSRSVPPHATKVVMHVPGSVTTEVEVAVNVCVLAALHPQSHPWHPPHRSTQLLR